MDNNIVFAKLAQMHPDAKCELNYTTPFELLVAVILSAQCTDKRVNIATEQLFKVYNTPQQYAALTPQELKPYIYSCGFFNNKAKNIIGMSQSLIERFDAQLPRTLEQLVTLEGVGRKTASVVLSTAFGVPAIAVDTHVFRVSHRLGLSEGSTPDKVEQDLRNAFAQDEWSRLHSYLVFHGRYICFAQKPNCGDCLLQDECLYFHTQRGKDVSR